MREQRPISPTHLARARTGLEDDRDRALAGEIASGTLRWQAVFDHVIAAFAGRPVDRLDPEVLTILRMSAFQLLHLDRVPAAAIVDDAVELVRKAGKTSASGFVNALLRRISRERARLPLPPPPTPPVDRARALEYLTTTLSHPGWLVSRWLDRYGYEATRAWAEFDNASPSLTIRANTLKTTRTALAQDLERLGVKTDATSFAPDGLTVRSGNPLLTPIAHDGRFAVQDEASQLVGAFVDVAAGDARLRCVRFAGGQDHPDGRGNEGPRNGRSRRCARPAGRAVVAHRAPVVCRSHRGHPCRRPSQSSLQ